MHTPRLGIETDTRIEVSLAVIRSTIMGSDARVRSSACSSIG